MLQRDGLSLSSLTMPFAAHWTRVMENSLDWPHLPFVHRRTIRDALPYRPDSRLDIAWEDRPWGGRTSTTIDGVAQPITLDYRFPNTMHLHLPAGRRIFELILTVLPVDDTTTHMIMVTVRDFLRSRLFDLYFGRGSRRSAARIGPSSRRPCRERSHPPARSVRSAPTSPRCGSASSTATA
ncbi:hypothetical protein [Nannocystis pusilla]|uniref:hypothetical protein n=1 Tax=Nannocystis pusilla TaxID=889268 RepID=UPI003B785EC1